MSKVCILTDSTVQLPAPVFPGLELVSVIPMHIQIYGTDYLDRRDLKLDRLPVSARNGVQPRLKPPSLEEFNCELNRLGRLYSEILVILSSRHLTRAVPQVMAAVASAGLPGNVHVVDSQSVSIGLGLMVRAAAEAAAQGAGAVEIKRMVLGLISRIYGIFCVQSLTYLHHAGIIDPAQALLGEMLGIAPIFLMENGRLAPVQKARNPRHLVDAFYEYVSEFRKLRYLALLQGWPPFKNEARNLHERIVQDSPTTPFGEYPLGASMAALLGPRSFGLMVMES